MVLLRKHVLTIPVLYINNYILIHKNTEVYIMFCGKNSEGQTAGGQDASGACAGPKTGVALSAAAGVAGGIAMYATIGSIKENGPNFYNVVGLSASFLLALGGTGYAAAKAKQAICKSPATERLDAERTAAAAQEAQENAGRSVV